LIAELLKINLLVNSKYPLLIIVVREFFFVSDELRFLIISDTKKNPHLTRGEQV
jgi:hypothetical protein